MQSYRSSHELDDFLDVDTTGYVRESVTEAIATGILAFIAMAGIGIYLYVLAG